MSIECPHKGSDRNVCVCVCRPHWAQCVWEDRVTHLTLWPCFSKYISVSFPFLTFFSCLFVSSHQGTSRFVNAEPTSTFHLTALRMDLHFLKEERRGLRMTESEGDGQTGWQTSSSEGKEWSECSGSSILTVFMAPDRGSTRQREDRLHSLSGVGSSVKAAGEA